MQTTVDIKVMKGINTSALASLSRGEEITPLKFNDREDDDKIREFRLGRITGSEFGKLVVKTKDKKGFTLSSGETASNYIYQVAWERLLKSGNISNGLGRLNVNSASMEHGNDYEGEAILKYMERTGREVDFKQRFIEFDDYIGGTPDGYVGKYGIVEVKCPWNGGNHIRSLLTGEVYKQEYVYQIQGYLWITGRRWCDFITYDPDLHERLQLNIIRVKRDEEVIRGIAEVMEIAKHKIDEIMSNKKLCRRVRKRK